MRNVYAKSLRDGSLKMRVVDSKKGKGSWQRKEKHESKRIAEMLDLDKVE